MSNYSNSQLLLRISNKYKTTKKTELTNKVNTKNVWKKKWNRIILDSICKFITMLPYRTRLYIDINMFTHWEHNIFTSQAQVQIIEFFYRQRSLFIYVQLVYY